MMYEDLLRPAPPTPPVKDPSKSDLIVLAQASRKDFGPCRRLGSTLLLFFPEERFLLRAKAMLLLLLLLVLVSVAAAEAAEDIDATEDTSGDSGVVGDGCVLLVGEFMEDEFEFALSAPQRQQHSPFSSPPLLLAWQVQQDVLVPTVRWSSNDAVDAGDVGHDVDDNRLFVVAIV